MVGWNRGGVVHSNNAEYQTTIFPVTMASTWYTVMTSTSQGDWSFQATQTSNRFITTVFHIGAVHSGAQYNFIGRWLVLGYAA